MCPIPCDPMDCSTPGFPVLHYLPEFAQTHVHVHEFAQTHDRVSDAIQPSFSFIPFSFCPQSFPASGCFPMNQFFTWGGRSIGVSASASVVPVNIQGWFPLGLSGLISLLSEGLSRIFSSTTVWKHQFFDAQPCLWSNSHICTWLTGKIIVLTIQTFVSKMMSLLFNTLSGLP